jgi:hypothetical protein
MHMWSELAVACKRASFSRAKAGYLPRPVLRRVRAGRAGRRRTVLAFGY